MLGYRDPCRVRRCCRLVRSGLGGLERRHRCDEAVPATRHSLDEARRVRCVAECRPDLRDAEVEAAFEIDERAVRPNLPPKGVSSHNSLRLCDEQRKHPGRLRLQPYRDAFTTEIARGGSNSNKPNLTRGAVLNPHHYAPAQPPADVQTDRYTTGQLFV